jgi:hypothetical protein
VNAHLFKSARARAIFSKISSLTLLFQRSPLVKILFPEAKIIGGAGLGEITKWTVATYAGLGAYDTVSGASISITQSAPASGQTNIPTAVGSILGSIFQYNAPNPADAPNRFALTAGSLPPGVTGPSPIAGQPKLTLISGVPGSVGSYPITITAYEGGTSSASLSTNFNIRVEPAIITTQPVSVAIVSGTSATLSVVGTPGTSVPGGTLTYQWYAGNFPTKTSPVGTNSPNFTTSTPGNYWVEVKRPQQYGAIPIMVAGNSNTVTVSIATAPSITNQPLSTTINIGETATLASTANGTSPSIQWFRGNSGDTSNPVPGANSFTFITPTLTTTTSYWMRASNVAGTANSNTATVTVNSVVVPPYDFWKAAIFTTVEAADPLISGPSADPDRDGVTNQDEFVFGTAPKNSGPVPNAMTSVTGNQLAVSFTATAATGPGYMNQTRHYALESSASLDGTWASISGFADITAAGQTVSYTATPTAAPQFFRLRVWITP